MVFKGHVEVVGENVKCVGLAKRNCASEHGPECEEQHGQLAPWICNCLVQINQRHALGRDGDGFQQKKSSGKNVAIEHGPR